MKIIRYSNKEFSNWNNFLKTSKNGTFLINRNYMDYHSDRFIDFSLMVKDSKNSVLAIFPASLHDNEIISHGGLTYGGFIVNQKMRTEKMLLIFEAFIKYLKENAFEKITYKAIPHIYHQSPSEEDLYCLFRYGFKISRRDVSSSINMRTTEIKGQKRNGAKKAIKNGLKIIETEVSKNILEVVNTNLKNKYQVSSVHTHKEMDLLKNRFKKNIVMLELLQHNNVVGGAILYIDKKVVHAQYVATTEEAKKNRGLDLIVAYIIESFKNDFEWFDFGISTEKNGTKLNTSLIKSKEEYNLSSVCYDFYELEI